MSLLYRNDRLGLYTEIDIPKGQEATRVPKGWKGFNGTWEDAQEDGLRFMAHTMAGFELGKIPNEERGVDFG